MMVPINKYHQTLRTWRLAILHDDVRSFSQVSSGKCQDST
jgi:hypothetical protein